MKYHTKYIKYLSGVISVLLSSGCSDPDQESVLQVQPQKMMTVSRTTSKSVSPVYAPTPSPTRPKKVKEEDVIWDPLEPWNRAVFIFNQGVEHVFWDPLLTVYRYIMPPLAQETVHNALEHIKGPLSILSSGLQGDGDKLLIHFARFMCNTLFGLGGLVDVASEVNLVAENEDLGKTMKAYNVPPGCFVMVPFLGPTVSRDAFGKILSISVYAWASPGALVSYGAFGAENLNQRLIFKDSIDHVLEFSADPYAMIRRAYYESRGELPDTSTEEEEDTEDEA